MTDTSDLRRAPFVVTNQHRRFVEFCDACRRSAYIGLCYGRAGVGKTLSARRYANWDDVEEVESLDRTHVSSRRGIPPPTLITCHTVLYTPSVTNTPRAIAEELAALRRMLTDLVDRAHHPEDCERDLHRRSPLGDPTQLILVDEADRLRVAGLEQLRDIYDRSAVGLVLIGMPGLERRLSRYAQLYSRVGFVHQYYALGGEELEFLLARKWAELGADFDVADYTTAEAVAAITRITGGNFRLLQRLFAQIERILEINRLRLISKEVVEAARQNLVIGVA